MRTPLIVAALVLGGVLGGVGYWQYSADRPTEFAGIVSIADDARYQDAALQARAWALPVAALYRQGFESQANASFCGPTSAANVSRSLGRADMDQRSALDGTDIKPLFGLLPTGVTLDQEAEILRAATGRRVDVMRDLDLAAFRAHLAQANDANVRYVANFNRAALWGQGHGHISPILGYLAEEDLVFVGDVNADYGPFLVSSARLLAAINTRDDSTGLSRGLLRVS